MRTATLPTMAAVLLLCGCAATPPAWRVEPVFHAPGSSRESLAQGYATLARMYEAEGRGPQALDAWRKAVAANPADVDLHTAAGVALVRQQRLDQAIEQFRAALALQPDDARLLNNLGYALSLEGADEEAAGVLGRALMLDPAHRLALSNLQQVEQRLALRLAPELLHGARPEAVAAFDGPPSRASNDDVPDKVLAMLRGEAPTPVEVQLQPNLSPLARVDTPATMPQPAPVKPVIRMNIVNGVGVTGAAAKMRDWIQGDGVLVLRLQNQRPYRQSETVVQYRAGYQAAAVGVAQRLPAGAATREVSGIDGGADLRVVLGRDRREALAAFFTRGNENVAMTSR